MAMANGQSTTTFNPVNVEMTVEPTLSFNGLQITSNDNTTNVTEEPSEPYSRNKMRMRNQAKAHNTGANVIRNLESLESSMDITNTYK